jgi:hypothetical protein
MQRLIDISLFLLFVFGGILLANLAAISIPLILILAVLLSILYWKTRRRVLACFCGIYALIFAALLLILPIFIAGILLADHQWDKISKIPEGNRTDVESHIFFARTVRSLSFKGLYMSCFYKWNEETKSWNDLNGRVYAPADGDKFYSYKVLGLQPIDVIYDRNDKIKLAFNSFGF